MQDTAEREDGLHVHKVSVVQGDFVHNKFLQEKKSSGRFRSLSNGSGGWKKAEEWLKKEEDGHRYPYIAGSWIQKQPEHFQLWKNPEVHRIKMKSVHCRRHKAQDNDVSAGGGCRKKGSQWKKMHFLWIKDEFCRLPVHNHSQISVQEPGTKRAQEVGGKHYPVRFQE